MVSWLEGFYCTATDLEMHGLFLCYFLVVWTSGRFFHPYILLISILYSSTNYCVSISYDTVFTTSTLFKEPIVYTSQNHNLIQFVSSTSCPVIICKVSLPWNWHCHFHSIEWPGTTWDSGDIPLILQAGCRGCLRNESPTETLDPCPVQNQANRSRQPCLRRRFRERCFGSLESATSSCQAASPMNLSSRYCTRCHLQHHLVDGFKVNISERSHWPSMS